MVTPPDIEAQILRYYHAEKWTIGTISRQLHVHHDMVRRVLAQAGLPRLGSEASENDSECGRQIIVGPTPDLTGCDMAFPYQIRPPALS